MRKKIITTVAITLLALTTACSDPTPSEETATPEVEEAQTPEAAPEESPSDEVAEDVESEESNDASDTDEALPKDPLIITVNGKEVDFDPTDVYCKVGGGELRHLIAKTNNRPPLLEVTPSEFAMLKLQKKGAPEKNTNPSGIEYYPDGVFFNDASIGNATLNGSLKCTDVKGK